MRWWINSTARSRIHDSRVCTKRARSLGNIRKFLMDTYLRQFCRPFQLRLTGFARAITGLTSGEDFEYFSAYRPLK